jgi:enoyl-[acyl-carrier protein] reductase II
MRVIRNDYTAFFEHHPDELRGFPEQLGRAMNDGTFHLGGGEDTPDVDTNRECYPTGQGVGAIQTLIPAATLVAQIVDDATRILAGMGQFLAEPTVT